MNDETEIRVILARLEGKLDTSLATHGAEISSLKDQVRKLENEKAALEKRVWDQEQRRFVSPAQLWSGILAAIGGATGIGTLLRYITPM